MRILFQHVSSKPYVPACNSGFIINSTLSIFFVFNWNVGTIRRSNEDFNCNIDYGVIDPFFIM